MVMTHLLGIYDNDYSRIGAMGSRLLISSRSAYGRWLALIFVWATAKPGD
jgi:hypothetical protein